MLASRQQNAWLHSDFYRDQFHKMLRWMIGSIFIIYVLLAIVIYLILFQPTQSFYANTTTGMILPMPPAITGT
ncbi:MAG: hypothetical protein H0W64_12225 [Gammaproteobacteria bacterium]|nr:hypothetical protein [Gammaproteobacteria bacterium]